MTVNTAALKNTITETGARNLLAVSMQAMALSNAVDVLFDTSTTCRYVSALINSQPDWAPGYNMTYRHLSSVASTQTR